MDIIISNFDKINIVNNVKITKNEFNYIIEPHKILDIINIDILQKYVKEDVENNIEYFNECKMTYKISDPKKAEWILGKAIQNSKLIGNGNTNIDISIDNTGLNGIDVSVLTLNNNYTNEKSIMQNFTDSNNLDSLFNIESSGKAVEIFKKKLIDKYEKKKNIYYLIFVCKNKNIYLSCLKFNIDNIKNMKFSKLSTKCKNIEISNFIDNKIGNVKLYKSKKRLELRLSKDIINNECCIKLY